MPTPILKVGSITIIPLSDGEISPPVADILPSITVEQWEPLSEYLNPDRTVTFNIGSFLIHEDGAWTLVDTGFGNRPDTRGGRLLAELAKVNVQPAEISRVILTHLHPDHIGGNTADRDGKAVPVFANARHVLQRTDWIDFQRAEIRQERPDLALCADPIESAGLLDLIDGNQALSAGISTLLTPGHTVGHQSILVASGDEKVIILGDVSHTPVQIVQPDWSPRFDRDPALSARTRGEVFDRIEQEGLKIAAGHYPFPGFGGIIRVEGKRRWQPMS